MVELSEEFVASMNEYIETTKHIEILKEELKQMKATGKKMLNDLIEEGERVGVDDGILDLLKSFKHK